MHERLQKFLASAGLGSRRACEELISEGRVAVNGNVVTKLGTQVDPSSDEIAVDGRIVESQESVVYMLNKPRGVVCSSASQDDRKRAIDFLPWETRRLYTVGRLDVESEGLILVTNDGELCNRLTHPRYSIPKTYRVVVSGRVMPRTLEKMQGGIHLSEGKTQGARIHVKRRNRDTTIMDVTLQEGRNREVRRIFARFDHRVRHLKRIRLGFLSLGRLPTGEVRKLKDWEVEKLQTPEKARGSGHAPKKGGKSKRKAPDKSGRNRGDARGSNRKTRS